MNTNLFFNVVTIVVWAVVAGQFLYLFIAAQRREKRRQNSRDEEP